jgi:oligo-1,6-glucosidase
VCSGGLQSVLRYPSSDNEAASSETASLLFPKSGNFLPKRPFFAFLRSNSLLCFRDASQLRGLHDTASGSVSRFGSDRPGFKNRSAKLLATMLLSLRGTPLIYQGEEIGMSNFPFTDVSQYDDIGVHNLWKDLVETGKVSAADYLSNNALTSRDNNRTPMQWDASPNAGFTKAKKPWLAVNPNYTKVNVQAENSQQDSVLAFYRTMIQLRKSKRALIFGSYRDISGEHSRVYSYVRSDTSGQAVVVLNFSNEPASFRLPPGIALKRRMISNVVGGETALTGTIPLLPWQSSMFE